MELSDIGIGQVVRSLSGRDQGKPFIVIGHLDEDHVLVVDGDLRRLDRPKKKKKKHVAKFNIISEEVKERVENNKKINNAFIRRELERLGVKIKS
ncbi:conserved hypothetical protein [Alkaliphilus metalliredigens QYMF]|uniref:Uncharacterized protein n=1 Tax=Alkaliphilus metalliredigens (strain QYMF) TaxID=293826 RepID=A6TWF9_ALKMQ|nr:KOW domain-containing RNA-binding protein [Alkaliphilus metalliredigens]ABR50527.1 conserved hypothetical protein [Alkaliphilus metalliredigens QYMF]